MNTIAASTALSAAFTEDPTSRLALAAFIEFLLPPLLRGNGTITVGKVTNTDVRVATRITAIPFLPILPSYGALAAQYTVSGVGKSELIWHYFVRDIIAAASRLKGIIPYGGWGTQREAQLWQTFGKRLENLGKLKSK